MKQYGRGWGYKTVIAVDPVGLFRTISYHSFVQIFNHSLTFSLLNMVSRLALGCGLLAAIAVQAMPAEPAYPMVTAAPDASLLDKRATSCTFSGSDGASKASKSKTSCSTIYLSDVAVPSGTTLDLTDLNDGTHVRFPGEDTPRAVNWSMSWKFH